MESWLAGRSTSAEGVVQEVGDAVVVRVLVGQAFGAQVAEVGELPVDVVAVRGVADAGDRELVLVGEACVCERLGGNGQFGVAQIDAEVVRLGLKPAGEPVSNVL
jgi:hypothetical protein